MPSPSSESPTGPAPKKVKLNDDPPPTNPTSEQEKSDKKKAKKAKRVNDKAFIESLPTFAFDGGALKARREPIGIDELRNLVMSVLLGDPSPRWLVVKNPQNIKHFVVLNIVGVSEDLLELHKSVTAPPAYPIALPTTSTSLTSLHKLFSHACPSRAPGDQTRLYSALNTFLSAPMTDEQITRRLAERRRQSKKVDDPGVFLLTPDQMVACNYVLPSYMEPSTNIASEEVSWTRVPAQRDETWVESPQVPLIDEHGNPAKQKIWALDCEMIETSIGRELARISLVDFHSNLVIFDSLVKPSNPVISYLTRFSGLTEEIMSKATITLPEIQKKLLAPGMIDSWTILVGHSLDNDLAVLKLAHPRVIDTSIIYTHTKGPPARPGLKWLANKWLGKTIQDGEKGHDSREDALTCAELLKQKMENGMSYGRFDVDQVSVFELLSANNRKSAFVGAGASVLGSKATTKVDCDDDKEIMKSVITNIPTHDFVFARLQQLSYALEWCTPYRSQRDRDGPEPPVPPLPSTVETLDAQIRKLHQSLPAYTALCIFTGHSDARKVMALNKRKSAWDSVTRGGVGGQQAIPEGVSWTAQDGRDLEDEVERAKRGLVFFCITLPKVSAVTKT